MSRQLQRFESILILGGSGFIGRHVLRALARANRRVVVGSRYPERIDGKLPESALSLERRCARFERLLDSSSWTPVLDGIDVVINCVGILRQRGRETYDRVHHQAPAALAGACRERGVRLIHVSALGLEATAKSRFIRSKLDGERAIMASGADWMIVRPSLLDGEGGFGAKWLRRVARWPVQPVPAGPTGRIASLDVRDLGEALARLARLRSRLIVEREIELGGTESRTLAAHLRALRRQNGKRPARQILVPRGIARLGAHLCDVLQVTPFSFGHWELLGHDNRPRRNLLASILGRSPRPVGCSEVRTGLAPRAFSPARHGFF